MNNFYCPEPSLNPPESYEDRYEKILEEEDAEAQRSDLECCDLPDDASPLFRFFAGHARNQAKMRRGF